MNGYLICLVNPFVYVWKPLIVVIHWNVRQSLVVGMHAWMNEWIVCTYYNKSVTPFITWCCSVNFASHFRFCVRFVCAVANTARPYRNFVIQIFISLSIFQYTDTCGIPTHCHTFIPFWFLFPSGSVHAYVFVFVSVCARMSRLLSFLRFNRGA